MSRGDVRAEDLRSEDSSGTNLPPADLPAAALPLPDLSPGDVRPSHVRARARSERAGSQWPRGSPWNNYAKTRRRRLELRIRKPSCFAWVLSPYQYGDFMIQAKLHIGEENGHSSAGFVFRYNNEDNFYYFLLSNRERFRFDVVFNKNPIHLIEWTAVPAAVKDVTELRIIARDNSFSFFLGDEWLAEASDDTLKTGFVGFAAQNYEEKNEGVFFLNSLTIESRPLQVEQEYLRWTRYVPISPQARITLARTYAEMGKHSEAVVQLKSALKHLPDSAEVHLHLARSYVQLKAYPESLSCLDRVPSLITATGVSGGLPCSTSLAAI